MLRRLFAGGCSLAMLLAAFDASGIEMFTYFGDGSRIGLPSLEVPIEAYPGIPLRSDRLRAKRRASRLPPGSTVRVGPGTPIGNVTIRPMPTMHAQSRVIEEADTAPEPIEPPTPGQPAAR